MEDKLGKTNAQQEHKDVEVKVPVLRIEFKAIKQK